MEKNKQLTQTKIFTENKDRSTINKYLLVLFAIIATFSLLVSGCSNKISSEDSNEDLKEIENEIEDIEDNEGVETTNTIPPNPIPQINESKNVSIDAGNKSEVIKTQENLAKIIHDGSYVEETNYMSPGGRNTIKVSIETKGDVVLSASVSAVSADGKSQRYINNFNSGISSLVVGKKINELNLPHAVSGSSLTTAAFKKEVDSLITNNPA